MAEAPETSGPEGAALARACARYLASRKTFDERLEARLDAVGPGTSRMSMTLSDTHTNFYGTAHGGALFALADSAFAYACNSFGKVTVAAGASIDFLRPGHVGDRLTAEAALVHRVGRTGLYDITITNQAGDLVARFNGKAHETREDLPLDHGPASEGASS
ncbi:hydroxyphenylacetyl-CoA thioesterase PaaI [Yunchengibacter salinarum]|uniref:hydroxyphenylacetyl-CoA thioesterase PaaI n=1 Tax=Yunchengibacter salinarum TaxID=3133399 RepID=UPI0035B57A44